MKTALALFVLLLPTVPFADACYSHLNCKGKVLYHYTHSTTAEDCLDAGGSSAGRAGKHQCFNIYEVSSSGGDESSSSSGSYTCTESYCDCPTGPRKTFGEVCP